MSRPAEIVKRLVDLLLGGLLLILLLPFGLIVALLIKLDSRGPVFFTEDRLGRDGAPFKVYKFRTMVDDAPPIRGEDGSWENPVDDPRVTRVGHALRRTSLDELPQLINVALGDMSLVGPRPDPVAALELYEPGDFARLAVRPGMTGWAAIHGRK
jgi:lipopolysaccharide/colanic/teichoic acid biosynthesis glycosyltransferase